MDVSAPHRAVSPGLDGDVLVLLAGRRAAMTGREIAEALGHRSHEGVRKSLARLAKQGIVHTQPAGNAILHTLNRDHVGEPAVTALAAMRTRLWENLRTAVDAWDPAPAHASVFGSAARGDGKAESDIDLLVVRPASVDADDPRWRHQVDDLRRWVPVWTGNRASVIELEGRDLAEGSGHPVLDAVRRDAIDLAGTPARKLAHGS